MLKDVWDLAKDGWAAFQALDAQKRAMILDYVRRRRKGFATLGGSA